MLHGCQKRIYLIKNIGGTYFEEAYLVLKNDAPLSCGVKHNANLAAEAEKIVRNACRITTESKPVPLSVGKVASFALGAASSSALIGTIALLVGLY